jgi:hypothetical protein
MSTRSALAPTGSVLVSGALVLMAARLGFDQSTLTTTAQQCGMDHVMNGAVRGGRVRIACPAHRPLTA